MKSRMAEPRSDRLFLGVLFFIIAILFLLAVLVTLTSCVALKPMNAAVQLVSVIIQGGLLCLTYPHDYQRFKEPRMALMMIVTLSSAVISGLMVYMLVISLSMTALFAALIAVGTWAVGWLFYLLIKFQFWKRK